MKQHKFMQVLVKVCCKFFLFHVTSVVYIDQGIFVTQEIKERKRD